MSERSNLRKWRSLNNDRARSSDEDSFRGQKVKSGLFFKLTIGLGFIAIICTLAIPNPKDQIKNDIKKIAVSSLDDINASELAKRLNNQNLDVSNQEEIIKKEIQGKIVEWELEILVVVNSQDYYKIVTKPNSDYPGTLLTLYPQNRQQVTYMDNVHPGTSIKVKGKIAGILQRRIKINPTLLM